MLTKKQTTWIVVCDGAQGRIFVNRGRDSGLTEIECVEATQARVPTRALGADRPGRTHESVGQQRHAMVPPADWHDAQKEQFAKEMGKKVNAAALENRFDRVILVAPPQALGDLRKALNSQAIDKVAGEIGKDLTWVADHDLGPHLSEFVTL